jgi:hypothetical protein
MLRGIAWKSRARFNREWACVSMQTVAPSGSLPPDLRTFKRSRRLEALDVGIRSSTRLGVHERTVPTDTAIDTGILHPFLVQARHSSFTGGTSAEPRITRWLCWRSAGRCASGSRSKAPERHSQSGRLLVRAKEPHVMFRVIPLEVTPLRGLHPVYFSHRRSRGASCLLLMRSGEMR